MTALRMPMIDDMVAAGLSASTQAACIRTVRGLAAHFRRSPEVLREAEVRSYFLHLRDQRGVAHGTFQPYHAGIQFLYVCTLDRDWPLFLFVKRLRQPPPPNIPPPAAPATVPRASRHRAGRG